MASVQIIHLTKQSIRLFTDLVLFILITQSKFSCQLQSDLFVDVIVTVCACRWLQSDLSVDVIVTACACR